MPTKNDKQFNPSLGGAFSNDAFNKGSVLLKITEENLPVLMENIRIGSSILLRFNKVTTKGNNHYFAEILPPQEDVKPKSKPAEAAGEID